ncbi:uncharacterized protein LOC143034242 [Oratosquilla oratoria]|uniref:uncharacterized protein LOC143034242 n=1 Tax=Oratosquilla oratoria TaxID=337810 RepID=UPI003F75C042
MAASGNSVSGWRPANKKAANGESTCIDSLGNNGRGRRLNISPSAFQVSFNLQYPTSIIQSPTSNAQPQTSISNLKSPTSNLQPLMYLKSSTSNLRSASPSVLVIL